MKSININFLIQNRETLIFCSVIVAVVILYYTLRRGVIKSRMTNDHKRRVISNLRSLLTFIFITSILILWSSELYQFTLSIAALAAAFAIAGKEIFLCFGGSFYRTFARPFSVGDRIEVQGIRGDVVDIGLMSTQLMEVGPESYTQQVTGRTITIPNSVFLLDRIYNETDTISEGRDFILHVFKVPIPIDKNWECRKQILLECAQNACSQYTESAGAFFKKLAKKKQIDAPTPDPRINIKFDSSEQIFLIVRVSIPVERRGTIEQQIIQDFLERTFKECSDNYMLPHCKTTI